MSPEKTDGYVNRQPNDSAAMHGSGSPGTHRHEFARRAKTLITGFPSNLDAEIKRRPYATVGIACAIGVGMGVLLGSRILRAILASTVSYALVDLGRTYLRQNGVTSYAAGSDGARDAS